MQDALKDFVLQERKRGVSDSDITHALQGAGWQVADIEMALATLPSTPASTWRMGVLAIGGIVAIAFLATLIFLMFRAPSATSTGGTARTVVAPVASASPQDVSPPVSVAQSTTTSQSTPTANTFALTSIFLKDDPTAQRIATGAQSSVDIRTFSLKIGDATAVGTDSFAYRLVSALRMLGYVPGSAGGQYMSESLLFPFERDNNLPVSDMVNAQVLKTLDAELAVRETKDAQLSAQFPLAKYVTAPPVVNEPTEEHAAALFTIAFKALPSQLVVWNEKNFQTYLAKQVTGSYAGLGTPNYRVCLAFLYPEFGDACAVIHKKVSGFWGSDFSIATTLLHEYAHYLDKNLYAPEQGTSLGIIDTSGFYAISYDTSKGTVTSNGWTEYPFLRPNDVANEFVSSYAEGWGNDSIHTAYEDFAESFALYVTGGRIFRELAKTSPVLSEKYLWLKEHVFGGQEYDTGDVASIAYLKAHATASGADAVATKAFNVIDYATQLPDFDWSYTF